MSCSFLWLNNNMVIIIIKIIKISNNNNKGIIVLLLIIIKTTMWPMLVFSLPHTCPAAPSPGAWTRCSGSCPRARGGCWCFHRCTGASASTCRTRGLRHRGQNCSQVETNAKKLPVLGEKKKKKKADFALWSQRF